VVTPAKTNVTVMPSMESTLLHTYQDLVKMLKQLFDCLACESVFFVRLSNINNLYTDIVKSKKASQVIFLVIKQIIQ
jgi:hypothetical protein